MRPKFKHIVLTALIIVAVNGCQEKPEPSKPEFVTEEPQVGTYSQTTDIPKGILTPSKKDLKPMRMDP